MGEDGDWLSNVMWTYEANFTVRGSVNCKIWVTENFRTFMQTALHQEKVTAWCGSSVIGALFFEEMRDSDFETISETVERYPDMLQNHTTSRLADIHLLECTNFMQDCAPPHIARQVKDSCTGPFVMISC